MQSIESLLATIAVQRTVGSNQNDTLLHLCETFASDLGYEVQSQFFSAPLWSSSLSSLTLSEESCVVLPSPFSPPCIEQCRLLFASKKEALLSLDASSSYLVLHGDLAAKPIKDSETLLLLARTKARALICLTGSHEGSALSPFPLIVSVDFPIPSCYAPSSLIESLKQAKEDRLAVKLNIRSNVVMQQSRQLLFTTPSSNPRLMVTSMLDSAYGTKGALFDAGSVAVLLSMMQQQGNESTAFLLSNGQAYGQGTGIKSFLSYNTCKFEEVISLTGLGCKNSQLAFQSFGSSLESVLRRRGFGEQTQGGNRFDCGLPELVLSSSNQKLMNSVRDTQLDTLSMLDMQVLSDQAHLVSELCLMRRP